jgi:YkoY family integral membrane protein
MLAALDLFGQTLDWGDVGIIGLLVLLEGALSIDNALVLGLLAKRLPKHQQRKALTYGLVGAFVFRFIAVFMASLLLKWRVVKLLGGGYLVYIAIKHLFFEAHEDDGDVEFTAAGEPTLVHERTHEPLTAEEEEAEIRQRAPLPIPEYRRGPGEGTAKFWPTVFVIEMTDIAFAVDSILAAIGVVGSAPAGHPKDAFHPKLWVIIAGGLLGVILMRFAAVIFIKLLEKFPRFSTAAYLLVLVIGGKLLLDWWFNTEEYANLHPDHPHRMDFHSPSSAAFWIFWGLMLLTFATGFLPKRGASQKKIELSH